MNYRYFRKYRKNPNPISPVVETEKKSEKKSPVQGPNRFLPFSSASAEKGTWEVSTPEGLFAP
jgi:hypothetical protein